MGISERKERQRKEVREGILNAAWGMVVEDGWQSLSIRKIADAIEYSVPVVYDHFENKEAILSVFNRQGFKLLGEHLQLAKDQEAEPCRQLEAIAYAYWDFAFRHKEYYQLMFGLGMPGCESFANNPELLAFISVIQSTIAEVAAGGKKEIDLVLKVQSFWSMVHGLVSVNLLAPASNHNGMSKDELNRMILSDFTANFIRGLLE